MSAKADSPCINLCQIGEDGLCKGCLRSLSEIAAWGNLSLPERAAILKDLPRRK